MIKETLIMVIIKIILMIIKIMIKIKTIIIIQTFSQLSYFI